MGDRLPGPRGPAQLRAVRQILRDPSTALIEMRDSYGPVCGLGAGPMRMAIVGDPAVLREMFSLPPDRFRWGHKFNVLGFVVGPGSMIVSDGAEHRRRRSSVQSAFSRRRLNGWIPMILDRTDAAIDDLMATLTAGGADGPTPAAAGADGPTPAGGAGDVVDLYPVGRRIVLGIVTHALFGEALAGRADEIGELFRRPQAYIESPAIKQIPHPFPHTARARVRDDRRALDAIIDAEIARRRARNAGSSTTSDTPTEQDGARRATEVNDARRAGEDNGGQEPTDILDVLVREGTLSDSEIRDQVVTLIGAGYDTTAATFAWVLWCAASEPGLWHRLREEADAVLGPAGRADLAANSSTDDAPSAAGQPVDPVPRPGAAVAGSSVTDPAQPSFHHEHLAGQSVEPVPRPGADVAGSSLTDPAQPSFDHEHLAALTLANHVMRETLRLHPPGVLSPREAAVDLDLGNVTIRKGTLILWSALLAGRDPGTWTDPLRFDPDRFADLTPEQKAVTDQGWVPFGRGARNCIGFALAQMELTLMIARFAQRLDVAAPRAELPHPVGMVVNRPEGGAPMRVAARRHEAQAT